jgi:hypothetical protein
VHRVTLHLELAVLVDQRACRFRGQPYFFRWLCFQLLQGTCLIAKHRLPPPDTPSALTLAACRTASEFRPPRADVIRRIQARTTDNAIAILAKSYRAEN